jgi:bacterioferritin-associated ferredoxin
MLVCHCRGVTDRTIREAVRSGASTADAVEAVCGAGGGCGGCSELVTDVIEAERLLGGRASERMPDSCAA